MAPARRGQRFPASMTRRCSSAKAAKRRALKLFEAARKELGAEIELLHDAHERYTPTEAVQFAKDLEQYRLFFLEDPLSPEDIMWFRNIRAQTIHAAGDGRVVQLTRMNGRR